MSDGDNMSAEVQIAVLGEQLKGVREQQRQHAEDTRKMFAESNKDNKDLFKEVFKRLSDLDVALNKGRGAFAAALAIAGGLGAAFTLMINYLKH